MERSVVITLDNQLTSEASQPPRLGTSRKKPVIIMHHQAASSTRQSFIVLGGIFVTSLLCLAYVYTIFPEMTEEEKQDFKLPRDIEDAKRLGKVLSIYKEQYYFEVMTGIFITYIFLQTFAIPGSIFLSILTGFLFPFWAALVLVCFCSATGASFCYLLSYMAGRKIVHKYFPEKAKEWALKVANQKDNLLNYIIFLRITPFLPNWFINITSPVIEVPLTPFFIGTFIGVAPPSFVAIQGGTTLQQLTSSSDAVSWSSVVWLAVFACLSLVPILFKQKLKQRFD
ncbi:Transmembrane protein 41B [Amphibalanus amphitrite]|uniref:Transmembrane protein 41B n=2 Tax=Amphibalanus amphitrite TaxID=1232801 RepID=A0A6A4VUN7_AMPAM|nr:transmembrane protein 41B-like isoform X1 [Amphibalanus amphitrite]XP_043244049.1 transmembrane protein 41B-like isoform X1 [Amphibalanus amphitrite]KAF0299757.1 Transmembrane protein 41B [Amphibalanus amphitrite]